MNNNRSNTLLRIILVTGVILLILVAGAGVTGAAARAAIPGDALYPVKTGIEQARLSMAQDAGERAQMKMVFAEQRLGEIEALVREGRLREIRPAVVAFETSINSALLELETLAQTDPARATTLAREISAALTRYATTLSTLAAAAPDAVKGEVNRALDTTYLAGGLNDARSSDDNGNDDNSNANANSNDDNGNDDSNGNANANSNDDNDNGNDDNSNGNGNDDNGNANINSNDDNSNDDNGNANINSGDDNTNDGSGNANMNANDDNSNDDSGNANMNANDDNSNDDSGSNSNDDSGSSNNGNDDNSNDD